MENNALAVTQVFGVTNIEYLISILYEEPEVIFEKILQLITEYKISDHEKTMQYLYELLSFKGYPEYAKKFAEKYNIQPEKA
jgi:hypothetical protein